MSQYNITLFLINDKSNISRTELKQMSVGRKNQQIRQTTIDSLLESQSSEKEKQKGQTIQTV